MKKIQWGLFIPGLVMAMMVPVWLLIVVPELNKLSANYYSSRGRAGVGGRHDHC